MWLQQRYRILLTRDRMLLAPITSMMVIGTCWWVFTMEFTNIYTWTASRKGANPPVNRPEIRLIFGSVALLIMERGACLRAILLSAPSGQTPSLRPRCKPSTMRRSCLQIIYLLHQPRLRFSWAET